MGYRSIPRFIAAVSIVGALVAGSAPAATAPKAKKGALGPDVTVMTRNLYLGADLFPILGAANAGQAEEAFELAYEAWQTIQATDFSARAERLADEIATTKPDIVGIQEAVTYRRDPTPGDGSTEPATEVVLDFLDILLKELAERGLTYSSVVSQTNSDLEVPLDADPDPGTIPTSLTEDLRFTDADVILVRPGVKVLATGSALYQARVSASTVIGNLSILRGWTSADLRVGGQKARVVNTHLEVGGSAIFVNVQNLQADELLNGPLRTSMPTILLGDLNSPADGSGTPTYGKMLAAGFEDVWPSTHPGDPGFTCCHNETLTNPTLEHDERVDLVMTRGPWGHFSADILGEDPADRTPSGLWPSDHSGVVATVALGTCDGKLATIVGGPARDKLKGTSRRDVVQSFGGNDVVVTKGGNDRLCGGPGNDKLKGAGGDDVLMGEAGRDRLIGGPGQDRCVGGPGKDLFRRCEQRSG